MTTFSEGGPSFKFFCVGDGGSVKVCGAELVASAQRSAAGVSNLTSSAEPAENRSHDRVEADEQVQKEAGKVSMLWDCLCGDTSQSISQDESPQTLDLHASSGRGAQRDSSAAGLVMDGSGGDGELQPAEEAVATHRDILLRAAQRRKRGSTDSDSFVSHPSLNFMTHSRKVGTTPPQLCCNFGVAVTAMTLVVQRRDALCKRFLLLVRKRISLSRM